MRPTGAHSPSNHGGAATPFTAPSAHRRRPRCDFYGFPYPDPPHPPIALPGSQALHLPGPCGWRQRGTSHGITCREAPQSPLSPLLLAATAFSHRMRGRCRPQPFYTSCSWWHVGLFLARAPTCFVEHPQINPSARSAHIYRALLDRSITKRPWQPSSRASFSVLARRLNRPCPRHHYIPTALTRSRISRRRRYFPRSPLRSPPTQIPNLTPPRHLSSPGRHLPHPGELRRGGL